MTKVSIVIPAKDEQESIGSVIRLCAAALNGIEYEIVVVDDSNDNTPSEVVKAGAKLVKQIGHGGYGEALLQGIHWTRGEYVVFFDADGTYDATDMRRMLDLLLEGEADVVNGNRFANMERGAMSIRNKIGNIILTWIGNILFHTHLKDSQCGMKAFRRDLIIRVGLSERGFPFASELLAEASKAGMRIKEIGITYKCRVGKSKLSAFTAGPQIFLAILRMLRDYDPLFFFVEVGLVLEALGFMVAYPAIQEYLQFGIFRLVGRALIAVFFWLSGLLSIFTGIILDAFNYTVKKIEARLSNS